ncbi:cupin domain-containing protein [Lysobacter xanthus]
MNLSACLLSAVLLAWAPAAGAHEPEAHVGTAANALSVVPLVEKKVAALPAGELVWRAETFASIDAARAAAGAYSLAAEADGRAWLFTLGAAGGSTPGGTFVREIGPIRRIDAPEYLLRINFASGPAGAVTPVHSHPGSEAFLVLAGEHRLRTEQGLVRIPAGTAHAGDSADRAMQISSGGPDPVRTIVLFVVDATRPFSTPAKLPPSPGSR